MLENEVLPRTRRIEGFPGNMPLDPLDILAFGGRSNSLSIKLDPPKKYAIPH